MYKATYINIEYQFSNRILHEYMQITAIVATISQLASYPHIYSFTIAGGCIGCSVSQF